MATVAEGILRLLEEAGVSHVFGVPGVHNLELYRALAGSRLVHVLPRHEQAAGFMADGFHRASGRLAACLVITGPGATNIATALATARADSVPVLLLATALTRRQQGFDAGHLHELPGQSQLLAQLGEPALMPLAPDAVLPALWRALAACRTGRLRPAAVEIPRDLLAEPAPPFTPPALPGPAAPGEAEVAQLAALVESAEAPVAVFGGGAVHAAEHARAFIARTGIPALTTVAGKGIVAESSPLSLGATLALEPVRAWLSARDLVLVVGSELGETDLWRDALPLRGRIVRVDVDPARLGDPRHPCALAIQADAARLLEALCARIAAKPRPAGEVVELRRRVLEAVACEPWHRQAIAVLQRSLASRALLFTDMTRLAYAMNVLYAVEAPRRYFHPSGFGPLGWALPAALGGALACPGTPVVAVVGDYGLQYALAELGTLVELALPVAVVVVDDGGLGQIRESMRGKGMTPVATALQNPDFRALAASFGLPAAEPASLEEFGDRLASWLERPGPVLLWLREEVLAREAVRHG